MSKTTQRTESKLLKATTDLLNHNGYKELDVKTITSLAGVSYGTFYNYFSSIDEIHRRVVVDKVIEAVVQVIPSIEPVESPLKRAIFAWYMSLKIFSDDPSAGWIIERPQVMSKIWQSAGEEMQEGLVIQAIKSGEIPGSEIDTLLHFRKARETLRAGYVYALEKIMNGSSVETVFYDFMTTLNLFNLNPKEMEIIVKEVLEDYKQKETV
jgi:AcrR family transcriptional regulator